MYNGKQMIQCDIISSRNIKEMESVSEYFIDYINVFMYNTCVTCRTLR